MPRTPDEECTYCGYPTKSLTFVKATSYGIGPQTEDRWLCRVCYGTHVGREIATGVPLSPLSLAQVANLLLDELSKH